MEINDKETRLAALLSLRRKWMGWRQVNKFVMSEVRGVFTVYVTKVVLGPRSQKWPVNSSLTKHQTKTENPLVRRKVWPIFELLGFKRHSRYTALKEKNELNKKKKKKKRRKKWTRRRGAGERINRSTGKGIDVLHRPSKTLSAKQPDPLKKRLHEEKGLHVLDEIWTQDRQSALYWTARVNRSRKRKCWRRRKVEKVR